MLESELRNCSTCLLYSPEERRALSLVGMFFCHRHCESNSSRVAIPQVSPSAEFIISHCSPNYPVSNKLYNSSDIRSNHVLNVLSIPFSSGSSSNGTQSLYFNLIDFSRYSSTIFPMDWQMVHIKVTRVRYMLHEEGNSFVTHSNIRFIVNSTTRVILIVPACRPYLFIDIFNLSVQV